ncbi:MAG: MFS transporter [Acidobacteriia bacterium]|nr:MFS transporter [Terriglobia bacterium]
MTPGRPLSIRRLSIQQRLSPDMSSSEMSPLTASVDAASLIARIENVPASRWHVKPRIVMGSATFFDAFSALSLAFALPVLTRLWHLTPQEAGLLISIAYVGQLAGAFLFTWAAEKYGRVPSATIAVAIMAVMSLGCALANGFTALLVCRLVQGIGIGGEMPVAAAYISELSQARGRGRFFLLYEIIFPVGLMATGQVGAWLVPEFGWQAIFLVGAVPCFVVAALVARLPESPRWLIARGRIAEAEMVVKQMEAAVSLPYGRGSESCTQTVNQQQTRWTEPLSAVYRARTLIVWSLWACAYFVANSLNNWMPSLYTTVYHLPLRQSLRAASLTNIAQVILVLLSALSIDRIGRRKWTAGSFLLCAALLGILAMTGAHTALSVVTLGTLSYGVVGSANAVLYLYTPEVYPTRMRAIGTGFATAWLRIASVAGPAVVGVMVARGSIASVFLLFAGVSICGALAATRMIETRRQPLEAIAP